MQIKKSRINSFLSNNLSSNHLAESICLFLIFYMFLFISAFLIGEILNLQFLTDTQAKASVISNMFVWSATLFAPIAALLLINSWKIQKKYEVQKEVSMAYLNSILNIASLAEELHALCIQFQSSNDIQEFGREIEKRGNELGIKYLEMIKIMKSNNNLYKGLFIKDTDEPLISLNHFLELHKTFDLYFEDIVNKATSIEKESEVFKKQTLDYSHLEIISNILRPAIVHLKSKILP